MFIEKKPWFFRTVPVEEGDVWIFFASHELHATVGVP